MDGQLVDRLLRTLDVSIDAFAICQVQRGQRFVANGGPEIEVHYVLTGTLHLEMPGGGTMVCPAGSVVLVPPYIKQVITADGDGGEHVQALDFCEKSPSGMLRFDTTRGGRVDLRFVCGTITANVSGSFGLLDTVRRPIAENLGGEPIVQLSYQMMLEEMKTPGLASRALTGSLMKLCVLMLLRRHFGRSEHEATLLSTLRDPRLGKAVTSVLDRPAARHSVAGLALIAGMSRSAFAREFTAAFGMSPMAFVARTRLHHAADMLRTTNIPVKVIAATIGFSSRSHFSRAFRDSYGVDPSAYHRGDVGSAEPAPVKLNGGRSAGNGHAQPMALG